MRWTASRVRSTCCWNSRGGSAWTSPAFTITTLVDQYLHAVGSAERTDLIRTADWLVMAAWLTWLKSRLLLQTDADEAQEAEQAQQALTQRLVELERVRAVADWLQGQPQLGWDMFERGYREPTQAAVPVASILMLLEACLGVFRLAGPRPAAVYQPRRVAEWTPHQAMSRIEAMLGEHPQGGDLLEFLPAMPVGLANREHSLRFAIASTLVAALELARDTRVRLRQDASFEPITVQATQGVRADRPAVGQRDDAAP